MTTPVVLSLCMIVRDSARTLRACLASIAPWVDEIIIVDTGSLDETIEIAKEFGAKIFHFPWIKDFSAARNVSLANATGKWLFWMDSDDTIDAENGRKLRELAYTEHPAHVLGFVMQVHCLTKNHAWTGDITAVDHVKLVRNHSDIRFERRIHEQLLAAIKRLNGIWQFTDIFVVHSGSDTSAEGRARKTERDLELLELEYADNPRDPFTLFNLGMTYNDIEEHAKSQRYLRECIEVSDPNDSTYAKTHAFLASSLCASEQFEEALSVCERGLAFDPQDPELNFRQGIIQHQLGQLSESVKSYRDSMHLPRNRSLKSVEVGIGDYLSRHNLAAVFSEMGRDDLAELEYRRIIADRPNYRPAFPLLARTLLRQRRITTLEREIENQVGNERLACELAQMRASLAATRGDFPEAGQEFARAVAADPLDSKARLAQCEFLFYHGEFDELVEALGQLERLCPKDPSAPFNLAVALMNRRQFPDALVAVERALLRRPDHEPASELRRKLLKQIANDDAGSQNDGG